MKKFFYLFLVAFSLSFFNGCAQKAVPANQVGQIATSYPATIKEIQDIKVQGTGELTSIGGMIAGGVLGNQVGGGSGNDLATMAGAMIGSVLGQKADLRDAKRITLALDDGRVITTILPVTKLNPLNFRVGDRVKVYISNGKVTDIRG